MMGPVETVALALNIPTDKSEGLIQRFWLKVAKTSDGCWLWIGAKATKTYGRAYGRIEYYVSGKRRIIYAHRLGYLIQNGALGAGLFSCHRCDVPLCVFGDHLFPGTHRENMDDMVNKGRSPKPPPKFGEDNPLATLTDAEVVKIRKTSGRQRDLASQFGVSQSTIWRLRHGIVRKEASV